MIIMSRENPQFQAGEPSNNLVKSLPKGPIVAWYGDDFTGAAAVMEVLTFSGLPSMLFLEPPTPQQLAQHQGLKGIGVASTARAHSPEWMSDELPRVFSTLEALKPELIHYKICTTLDSSPSTGSIGRVLEIAVNSFNPRVIPILVAAPQMQRYQIFGHLFAGVGDQVYRLDRHPVMARHPVTPMDESDVARHIAKQTELIEVSALKHDALSIGNELMTAYDSPSDSKVSAITLDSWDDASETKAGRLIWENRRHNRFVVGSQGVEFALVRHWQETGVLPIQPPVGSVGRASQMVTISGSVSPTTADQIAWSLENGFAGITFDATKACGEQSCLEAEESRVVSAALIALSKGEDPLIYTASGPDDLAVKRFYKALERTGSDSKVTNRKIGEALGRVLRNILQETEVRRVVVSGGDTSGYATQQLGIFALTALAPTIPGASIFRAHAENSMDGLEIALKGGQMGSPDYFGWIRDGGGER